MDAEVERGLDEGWEASEKRLSVFKSKMFVNGLSLNVNTIFSPNKRKAS